MQRTRHVRSKDSTLTARLAPQPLETGLYDCLYRPSGLCVDVVRGDPYQAILSGATDKIAGLTKSGGAPER